MEGSTLYPEKTDAQVEAELAQATRQIEMLSSGQMPRAGGGAAAASAEDCARKGQTTTQKRHVNAVLIGHVDGLGRRWGAGILGTLGH